MGRRRRADGNHAEHGKGFRVTPHELKNPDTGIRTGVDCLRRFRQGFGKITDPVEKIKFTLAAYNAGIGHIYDANGWQRNTAKTHTSGMIMWRIYPDEERSGVLQ